MAQPSNSKQSELSVKDGYTRKPYRKPVLVKLGSIRDVTLANNNQGNRDGGKGFASRTGRGGIFDGSGNRL